MNRGMSELNNTEIRLLSRLERKSQEQINNLMEDVYNEFCMVLKLDYSQGYGLGSEGIKEYILAIILLDIIEEQDDKYLIGSLKLLIKGIWGSLDYAKVMRYVAREKIGIRSEVWHQALDIVEERFPKLLESDLAIKKTKEPIFTDVGMIEKISVLENLDEEETLEDRIENIVSEKKNKTRENKPIEIQDNNYDDEQISMVNYHMEPVKEKKKTKVILVIAILVALTLMFFWIRGVDTNKPKDNEKPTNSTTDTSNNNNSNNNNLPIEKENSNKNEEDNIKNEEDNIEEEIIDPSLKTYDKVNYKTASKYYCLYSQAFVYEKGAKEVSEKIKAQNIYSKVVREDNCYKVRIGSVYNIEEGEKIQKELKNYNINTYVLAYDKDVENKIEEIRVLSKSEDVDTYKAKYVNLRNEIKNLAGYGRYLSKIDYIYRDSK